MADENSIPLSVARRQQDDALHLGPRKKPRLADPLISHGRHFGRTLHAFCNIQTLLTNGLKQMSQSANEPEETFTPKQQREHDVFQALLKMVPGLEERLAEGIEGDVATIAEMLQKGMSTARSDDTKGLKGPILDWIVPHGQSLQPPLPRNIKTDRGFHHERTGSLLCPTGMNWSDPETKAKLQSGEMAVPGDQWPTFLYANNTYDPEDPWKGLLRSSILVCAYKHVFTSPSSVDNAAKATRSGNARIHGMIHVTPASIAYIATQARFALSSSSVFSRTDTVTDSEGFYNSILDLLYDADEQEESKSLVIWWNRQIFPSHSLTQRPAATNSALAKIKEKRALKKAAAARENSSQRAA